MRDGRAEPRGREAYLKQYVDRLSGEPTRRQACCSSVSAVAVEVFVNNAGFMVLCLLTVPENLDWLLNLA